MKLNKEVIFNVLSNFGAKLVSKNQLKLKFSSVLQSNNNELDNLIKNLRKKKWIKYIFQSYFYILDPEEIQEKYMKYSSNEAVFAVLNKLNIDWYLGLESAVIENKLSWSMLSRTVIINSKISGVRKILGAIYEFKKMKPSLFKIGIKSRESKNRLKFYYSDYAKTMIDYYYFRKNPPLELREKNNSNLLADYLKNYPKAFKKKVMYQ